MNFSKVFIVVLAVWALSGCSTTVKLPEGKSGVTLKEASSAWASVLKNNVDSDGWVNFENVKRNPDALNTYVAFISKNTPKSNPKMFPSAQDRLAYYLDSYNALSMYNVIDAGIPADNASLLRRARFFVLRKMEIGGERMSLKAYEDDQIRTIGDPRVHFALNCMAVSCPILKAVPFEASKLDSDLDARSKFFFAEKRNFYLDKAEKTAWVSEILKFFPDDFKRVSPSVEAFINKYAPEKIPADYKLKYIPYNWTVINQANKPKTTITKAQ